MNDITHPIVVGMMQTPPYDRMFEQSRRVYSAKGISPTLHTCGGQSGGKGIGGAVNHVRTMSAIKCYFATKHTKNGELPITSARLYLLPQQGYTYYLSKVIVIRFLNHSGRCTS